MRNDIEKPSALQLCILLWQRELLRRAEQRKGTNTERLPGLDFLLTRHA
jgi:hypothetical protein